MAITQSPTSQTTTIPAGRWQVDSTRSEVEFNTRMFGLVPVRGRYAGYAGELDVDEDGNASGGLRIDAATISTGIKKRDTHLRSPDFFSVEEHPTLHFALANLVPGADGVMTVMGTLQLRNEAFKISTSASVTRVGKDELRLEAQLPVDHKASGLGWKAPKDVRVRVALTLKRSG